mgnify:CR=1 FL=1|jgi:dihydrofolate synthase / folylpolyglutamate synthase
MPPRPIPTSPAGSKAVRRSTVDRAAVVEWLDGRINHERTSTPGGWGLGRMRRLLKLLGSPQRGVAVVHVAGTKGKGSTVAMLAAILQASGSRVGRYMSPHVHGVEERIAVNNRQITLSELTAVWQPVRMAVEQMDREAARQGRRGPTWFEILTAMAMLHFRRQRVELAILETGLGGRLDATNVCEPVLTVITSISLDHMAELGDTVGQIAWEKAGIIKRGCPVLCAARDEAARKVIAAVAARRRSPLVMLDRDFSLQIRRVAAEPSLEQRQTVELVSCSPRRIILPPHAPGQASCAVGMAGLHQAENAGVAVAAASLLHARGYPISWPGLQRSLLAVQLPARIEQLGERPLLIVDAAHNAASMESLCRTLPRQTSCGGRRVLVFAASAEKQIEEMLGSAGGWADRLILTRYTTNPRAASLERLIAAAHKAVPLLAESRVDEPDPLRATRHAKKLAGAGGIVCVAGSFFLAAEVRRMLLSDRP